MRDVWVLNFCEALKRTSGGMAIAHMATPAVPPATMMAPRLSCDGDEPAGVRNFFVTSYAAKYLSDNQWVCLWQEETKKGRTQHFRDHHEQV